MTATPPLEDSRSSESNRAGQAGALDDRRVDRGLLGRLRGPRWTGWRGRTVMAAALLCGLALVVFARSMAVVPALPVVLQGNDSGVLLLTNAVGTPRAVRGVLGGDGQLVALDSLLLQRSARWLARDDERARQIAQHDSLANALAAGSLQLLLDDAQTVTLDARPHGSSALGAMFWLATVLALSLCLVTTTVLLSRPETRNCLYALMAMAQAGNLLFLAIESIPALGMPAGFMRWDHDLRVAFDLATGAALVHVTGIHPRQLSGNRMRALLVWFAAAALAAAILSRQLANTWWWTQAAMVICGVIAVAQLAWMQRTQPHPRAAVLLRFCALLVGALMLLTLSIATVDARTGSQAQAVSIGAGVWTVFVASMLLMLPFLSRSQQLMREFALLATVSTVAASLDLLFVTVFALGDIAALMLALFLSLGAYAGMRQWLLKKRMARERLTTERMFERLYRVAREFQAQPQGIGEHLIGLLREMFDPLEVKQVSRRETHARVVSDGASLLVPVPRLGNAAAPNVIVLDFSKRGRRMFTDDDARLADRVVDQLTRAIAYDQAVERGRSEERVRIAQDLHDDIGARLLTLMYQAPTRDMEDYLRHTLKDLKTLTRGLAAPNHRLSHAVAEWKSDITQRLVAADCDLKWAFSYDRDFELSVVQWSALTRILRELVSNTLAHAHATRVEIDAALESGVLTLSIIDDGCGRNPDAWSHGLGLGGVRKRVKQLGGTVHWRENGDRGIACHVVIAGLVPAPH